MSSAIHESLKICGVPSNILGYKYLTYAIECVIADASYADSITKKLYPAVAKQFNTTYSRAERAMRHAVTVAFNNISYTTAYAVFGNTVKGNSGCATLSQFITTLAEYVQEKNLIKGCGKMMSELTRLRDEAVRLLTIYEEHHDNQDDFMRRKAHVDLDRFLMENRETAMLFMIEGLKREIGSIVIELDFEKPVYRPWYKKIFGGMKNANRNDQIDKETINHV